jgi:hypothetical protein
MIIVRSSSDFTIHVSKLFPSKQEFSRIIFKHFKVAFYIEVKWATSIFAIKYDINEAYQVN